MAKDLMAVLQASTTKTDTFQSTGYDLLTGTPNYGLVALVEVSTASNASGNATITFSIEHSDSSGSGYTLLASGIDQQITTSTTATAYSIKIPFRTRKRYVRLVATYSSTTGTPTSTYAGYLVEAMP